MPDFLHGQYASHSWMPPDTPEKQKAFGEFFQGPANFGDRSKEVGPAIEEIVANSNGTIKKWTALGLCWGGKVSDYGLYRSLQSLSATHRGRG